MTIVALFFYNTHFNRLFEIYNCSLKSANNHQLV